MILPHRSLLGRLVELAYGKRTKKDQKTLKDLQTHLGPAGDHIAACLELIIESWKDIPEEKGVYITEYERENWDRQVNDAVEDLIHRIISSYEDIEDGLERGKYSRRKSR